MAKRPRQATQPKPENNVHPLYGSAAQGRWDPLGEEQRDQSYVKKVRPQSDNQRALLEAMAEHNLTLALARPEPARPIWPFRRPSKPWTKAASDASCCPVRRWRPEKA